MSAVPTDIPVVAEPGSGRSEPLPRNARIYFLIVAGATAAATLAVPRRACRTRTTGSPFFILGYGGGDRAALPRADAARPGVPHGDRLPDRGGVPAAAGARRPDGNRAAHPGVAEDPLPLVPADLQHLQLHARLDGGVVPRTPRSWAGARSRDRTLRVAVAGLVCCVVFVAINHTVLALMLHFARGHTLRETGLFEVRALLDRPRARGARRRDVRVLGDEPVADPVRDRAARPRPPLAGGAAAAGRGARRPEDGSLQRAPLRSRAGRGDRPRRSGSSGRCR